MDIHIDLETIEFFVALVIAGSVYGWYCYKKGMQRGWDDMAYELSMSGYIDINHETLEISRVSDKQYKRFQQDYQEEIEE